MIAFATFAALFMAAPSASSIDAPRRAYSECLRGYRTTSLAAKMDPVAFASAVKTACPAEAARLTAALIAFDVAMGSKRPKAQANAAADLESYTANMEESYKDHFGPGPTPQ